jgi:MATE family multidrug resistance protein
VGTPLGLQFLLEVGSFAVLASMIAAMSDVQMAAHQIAIQVIHFSFLPAYAVGEAASVLVGQAVGARRDELVKPLARRALWMGGTYMGACAVVFVLAGGVIVAGFTPDARVREVALHLLWIAAVFQVFDGVNIVARCALRGTGDVKWPAWIGIVTAWGLTPPLTWLLGWRLGLGAAGGWLGLCAEVVLGAVLLWWRLERGAWGASAERSRNALEPQTETETMAQAA